jgi:non-specific serine/threonine protein kinase
MRNTIAWSHDFLTPEEQTLFRRLAVFPGGCTIEAAEAVASGDGTIDVFGGIASVVDKSLLRQEEGSDGEPRFRMLETVREFGREQLETSGEGDATRDRLAAWCLALVEQFEPAQFGGNIAPTGIARLEEELPNLRAAITWLLDHEATRALRVVVAAEDFWTQRHLTDVELHRWLETTLAAVPTAPARDRALAHWLLSNAHGTLGHNEAALHHAERLLDAAEESGDPAALGTAHLTLGYAWQDHGDIARAADAYAEAIKHWRGAGGHEAHALGAQAYLADCLIIQGDLEAGVPMLEDALTRLRQSDPPWFLVVVINLRGYAALRQGDLPSAARLFRETIDVARNLPHTQSLLSAMAGLAGVTVADGQAAQAARLLGAIEAALGAAGMIRVDNWLQAERITADTRAALEPAAFERAWGTGRALPLEEAVAEARTIADEVITSADD